MKEYFSHDYYARNDKRLVKLRMKHGLAGIGAYWCIVEMLYEEGGYLQKNDYDHISFDLQIDIELIKSIIHDFELFKFNDKKFWSESAILRLNERIKKSRSASQSALKRWHKAKDDANAIQPQSESNAIKEKEIKKKYNYNEFYDAELELSGNDVNYLKFIRWLFGENIYKRPLKKVLAMQEQVSWKQFDAVMAIHNEKKVPIRELLEEMENWLMGKPRKNKTVLGTLRTFANNRVKK